MTETCCHGRGDWVASRKSFLLAWGLPAVALAASVFMPASWRTVLWPLCFLWMGVACLGNAARCGRMHCRFTGPFFLVVALLSFLHGLGLLGLGAQGWTWIGLAAVSGAVLLWWLPERVWGRYGRPRACGATEKADG